MRINKGYGNGFDSSILWSVSAKEGLRKALISAQKLPGVNFNNMHQLDTLHNHFYFIKTQSLDMFRPSLAHPQEALPEHSFGGCSVLLQM
jgi:hypothetical protein